MLRLVQTLQDIRHGLWFVPTVLVAVAVCLAALLLEFDAVVGPATLSRWPRVFGGGAEGVRSTLQAIASAMVSVAALTFSITVLVLSTAATQYTPAIIRTFMASRPTQWVLGIFLGIFVYCLVVLRSIRGGDASFVPSLAVTFALALALLGVGVLVYFIHHVASSIQASAIVSGVAQDTIRTIRETYPRLRDQDKYNDTDLGDAPPALRELQNERFPLASFHTGYLRTVDLNGLAAFACKYDASIVFESKVGDFLVEGGRIATSTRAPDDDMLSGFQKLYTVGHYRTVEQDVGVGMRQLVDIALRAGSPAVNDTSTTLLCIDYLAAVLIQLGKSRLGTEYRNGEDQADGKPMVKLPGKDFGEFLSDAFDPLRQSAGRNIEVYLRLIHTLKLIEVNVETTRCQPQIARQMELLLEDARLEIASASQLALVEDALRKSMITSGNGNSNATARHP